MAYHSIIQTYPHFKRYIDHAMGVLKGYQTHATMTIEHLPGGLSSAKLFKLSWQGSDYVLRILNAKYSVERKLCEVQAHGYAVEQGIAPQIIFAHEEGDFIIMDYIQGHTLNSVDSQNPLLIQQIGQALEKLHQFKGSFSHKATQVDRVKKHVDRAQAKGLAFPSIFWDLYEQYLKDMNQEDSVSVLCHGDFNPGNIIVDQRQKVYLIDWTTATFDDPFTDLGYLSFNAGFSEDQSLHLLKAYLGHEPRVTDQKRLERAQRRGCFFTATVWLDYNPAFEDKSISPQQKMAHYDTLLDDPTLKTAHDTIKTGDTISPLSNNINKIQRFAMGYLKSYSDWS